MSKTSGRPSKWERLNGISHEEEAGAEVTWAKQKRERKEWRERGKREKKKRAGLLGEQVRIERQREQTAREQRVQEERERDKEERERREEKLERRLLRELTNRGKVKTKKTARLTQAKESPFFVTTTDSDAKLDLVFARSAIKQVKSEWNAREPARDTMKKATERAEEKPTNAKLDLVSLLKGSDEIQDKLHWGDVLLDNTPRASSPSATSGMDVDPDSLSILQTYDTLGLAHSAGMNAVFSSHTFEYPAPSPPPIFQCLKTITALRAILENPSQYRQLLRCSGRDAQVILDGCQLLLDSCDILGDTQRQITTTMRRLSAKTQRFPLCFVLHDPITLLENLPVSSGSFGDIFKAISHKEVLCLKVLRVNQSLVKRMAKLYAKEAIIWSQLSHASVLPFYGIRLAGYQISLVAPWAERGNIGEYLKRIDLFPDRILLCADTAAGVEYLHSRGIVHGDLKTANALVDRYGRAYIADFGLSNFDDPEIAHWASQSSVASKGGTARWQAPELHMIESEDETGEASSRGGVIHNTKKSDVFAWGCLCYEIFTGLVPFHESPNISTVILRIIQGQAPSRPTDDSHAWLKNGLTKSMWKLMESCWKFDPVERPDMASIVSRVDIEKPVDHRPAPQWPVGTAARFRNMQGVDPRLPRSLDDFDVIISKVTRGMGDKVSAKL